jgi:hypothetical protein
MLTLTITKEWFDLIKSKVKVEEYRKITPYYDSRFSTVFGADVVKQVKGNPLSMSGTETIALRNGYGNNRPTIYIRAYLQIGYGFPAWGAAEGEIYYILHIQDVSEVEYGDT